MKKNYKLALILSGSIALASCTKQETLDYNVEKPGIIAAQEQIDAYNPLKTYIDKQARPGFKFGTAVSLNDYVSKGLMYRLANSNFDEITIGYEMKHGAVVQANGDLSLKSIEQLIAAAKAAGMSIYGHTLAWHSNQNATYLNKLIAPVVTASTGPTWDLVTGADFETDSAPNYETSSRVVKSFTAAGEGFNGVGRAIKLTNASVLPNDYDAQFFLKFSPAVAVGEKYELSMKIRSDANASFSTQAHTAPGQYKFYDFFGTLSSTPVWTTYTKEITVTADMAASGAIAFNLGKTATNFYFDNITLKKYNATGGVTMVEKTAEQKKTLVTAAMDTWIKGMVTATKDYVKVWNVVNEPMDDAKPSELKTGAGRKVAADEFYWQDYMGKDYAVKAFQLARQYGNATDIHFINDYNLEYDLAKCRGLIDYVAYIEKNGAKVDGIGTQMHINSNSDKSKIDEMFRLLAATGKLIKVSELDMGIAGKKTPVITSAEYAEQKEMYRYVIEKYFEIIPKAQQYGICIWSPLDSPTNSSWRAGEPIGLWSEGFVRKPAYVGVADALSKK
ncbi:endo-1,4-beta-xylanase [Mucilaginibacter sp. CSA2-8R]|uniref:endo-1,4-beta-xylanase n=1 Tax=Mucilaginibacter sp. CSA2-8R TaxID=3141542 RepID=UPI00315D2A63